MHFCLEKTSSSSLQDNLKKLKWFITKHTFNQKSRIAAFWAQHQQHSAISMKTFHPPGLEHYSIPWLGAECQHVKGMQLPEWHNVSAPELHNRDPGMEGKKITLDTPALI